MTYLQWFLTSLIYKTQSEFFHFLLSSTMTSITDIRVTQDLERFPNDGSLVAANKLAERDGDDYI